MKEASDLNDYLRKDKSPRELFELAKRNYHNLTTTDSSGLPLGELGVVIASIPMTIQDCNVRYNCKEKDCKQTIGLDNYFNKEENSVVCHECYSKMSAKEKACMRFLDWRRVICDCCGEQAAEDDPHIFQCIDQEKAGYYQCINCNMSIYTLKECLEPIFPLAICAIIADYLVDRSFAKFANFAKQGTLIPRSKFLTKDELRKKANSDFRSEDGTSTFIDKELRLIGLAEEWAASMTDHSENYFVDVSKFYPDWDNGADIKLYYREEYKEELCVPFLLAYIREHAELLARVLELEKKIGHRLTKYRITYISLNTFNLDATGDLKKALQTIQLEADKYSFPRSIEEIIPRLKISAVVDSDLLALCLWDDSTVPFSDDEQE